MPIKIVAGLILALAIGLSGNAAAAAEPAATLDAINRAIDQGDTQSFQKFVDVDGILNDSLNTFLRELKKPEITDRLPPLLTLMFSQAAAQSESGETLRVLLRDEARAFVLNGVDSGAFAGRKPINANAQGLLAPLFNGASLGRKAITGGGKVVKSGNSWFMPFTVHDYGNERNYTIKGRFSKNSDGSMRLVGIENIPALLARISAESME